MHESVPTNTSLWSKGMKAVIVAQFLSAFGDNALLFATLALLKAEFYPDWSQPILQMVFVGAYILFAPFVGQIADSFPKGRVMMVANGLKLLGAASICIGINPFIGYTLVGVGAAAYSPAKYGILGELTTGDKLVKANGLMESSTIAAILLGSMAGGILADWHVLASLGIAEIDVIRKVRVAVFSTGDELQLPGQPLKEGQIYDTNRLAVHLMLEQLGCEVINLGIIPDDPEKLRAAFIEADKSADVVISSGGVSVGEADYTKTMLEELGEIAFWKLAIKPGKPFAFGKLEHSWFCGLPGNPVSAALTFYQLVQPLLAKLSGSNVAPLPVRQRVRAATRLKKSPGRLDFQRGILTRNADGELEVSTTGHQGSHIFSSFSQGNCFIVLERERGSVEAGEWVEVESFNHLFGG